MKNNTKKIFAISALAPFLFSAGLAFAQPNYSSHENVPVAPAAKAQVHKETVKKAPVKVAKKAPAKITKKTTKRYVKVRGKHGKYVTIDCWKKSNSHLKSCHVR